MFVGRILKSISILFFAGIATFAITGCGSHAPQSSQRELQADVFYLNRMALPENAEVTLFLQDVSRADAPAITLAEQTIRTNGQQVPIRFTLSYNPQDVDPRHTYTLRAQIFVDGQMRFTTTEHIPVKLDGTDIQPVQVKVSPV